MMRRLKRLRYGAAWQTEMAGVGRPFEEESTWIRLTPFRSGES
jgi:hypothetical protein